MGAQERRRDRHTEVGRAAHVEHNAAAAAIRLTDDDLLLLDAAFPPPLSLRPLERL